MSDAMYDNKCPVYIRNTAELREPCINKRRLTLLLFHTNILILTRSKTTSNVCRGRETEFSEQTTEANKRLCICCALTLHRYITIANQDSTDQFISTCRRKRKSKRPIHFLFFRQFRMTIKRLPKRLKLIFANLVNRV